MSWHWKRIQRRDETCTLNPLIRYTSTHQLTTSSKSCSPSGASTANALESNTALCISVMASASSSTDATSMVRLVHSDDSSYNVRMNEIGIEEMRGREVVLMTVIPRRWWHESLHNTKEQLITSNQITSLQHQQYITHQTPLATYQILEIVITVRCIHRKGFGSHEPNWCSPTSSRRGSDVSTCRSGSGGDDARGEAGGSS